MLYEAYQEICTDAEKGGACFVSLYEVEQCYGGPEEGGWYYDRYTLKESQRCETRAMAETLRDKVRARADELTAEAKREQGEICRQQIAWNESRGIYDAPDYGGYGADTPNEFRYCVLVEDNAGELASGNERPHYE